jgi:hypothetical protein
MLEEIHIGVDRATAYALLRRTANGAIDKFLAERRLSKSLNSLQLTLSYGPPGELTPLQSHDLTFKLQHLLNLLTDLSRTAKAEQMYRFPFFAQYPKNLQISIEDVHSVVEFVTLSSGEARKVMKQILGYCTTEGCDGKMELLTQADAGPLGLKCPVCMAVRRKEDTVTAHPTKSSSAKRPPDRNLAAA